VWSVWWWWRTPLLPRYRIWVEIHPNRCISLRWGTRYGISNIFGILKSPKRSVSHFSVSCPMRYCISSVSQVLRGPARYTWDTLARPNGPLVIWLSLLYFSRSSFHYKKLTDPWFEECTCHHWKLESQMIQWVWMQLFQASQLAFKMDKVC
jgi:hypothetical protein